MLRNITKMTTLPWTATIATVCLLFTSCFLLLRPLQANQKIANETSRASLNVTISAMKTARSTTSIDHTPKSQAPPGIDTPKRLLSEAPSSSSSCEDNPSHRFKTDLGLMQSCAWFTQGNNMQRSKRINKYCLRSDVKYMCAETCRSCREAETCDDDPDFTFDLINTGTTQFCNWITANESREDDRRNNYCTGEVLDACPKSCGFCPTKSTPRPPDATCEDEKSRDFLLDNGSSADCSWLTKNPNLSEDRISKYCPRENVMHLCSKTCGTCSFPCKDDHDFVFPLTNMPNTIQSCDWITENSSKMGIRRATYCSDKIVGKFCPNTCGFCPSQSGPPNVVIVMTDEHR